MFLTHAIGQMKYLHSLWQKFVRQLFRLNVVPQPYKRWASLIGLWVVRARASTDGHVLYASRKRQVMDT